MTEILAKEETQASLWQQRYKEALAAVPDNILFFLKPHSFKEMSTPRVRHLPRVGEMP